MLIRPRPAWWLPESAVTPESDWLNRRRFVAAMGLGSIGLAAGCKGTPEDAPRDPLAADPGVKTAHLYPALRNRAFTVERPITDERIAATYNNFYEFTTTPGPTKHDSTPYSQRNFTPFSMFQIGQIRVPVFHRR